MAEDKKGFLLYADMITMVRKLPKEKAGELFVTILSFVNDENPEVEDLLVSIAFEPIKQQLKRDLIKFEEKIENKSESGKMGNLKRWHTDLYELVIDEEITLKKALIIAKDRSAIKIIPEDTCAINEKNFIANIAVNDNVTVNDNDNDNDNVTVTNIKRANALVVSKSEKEILEKKLRQEYNSMIEDLNNQDLKTIWTSLKEFIAQKSPPFIEPYFEMWNLFAKTYNLSSLERINDSRKKKFKTRLSEEAFDFLRVLEKIKKSNQLRGVDSKNTWKVTFDWILENDQNYLKILEGNYE